MINDFLDTKLSDEELLSLTKHYIKAARVLNRFNIAEHEWILFPYGRNGRIVEDILREHGVVPAYIFDNELCKTNKRTHPLKYMEQLDPDRYMVIVCSDRNDIYSEVRTQISKYVAFEKIVDVFSPSLYFDPDAYFDKPYFDKHEIQYPRRTALEFASKEIYKNRVKGAVAEVGVYQGNFANSIARVFPERTFYLFDTFEGFDDRDIDDKEQEWSLDFRTNADHKDTSVEIALANIDYQKRAMIRKGYFPDTAKGLEDETFAFVSLDTDLYKPIIEGLRFFWPRMEKGGYIFVDDLSHAMLPGVRKAVLDFCIENHIGYVSVDDGVDSTAVFVKPF